MIPAAFFAPLKAPDHPTPSGDRTLARGLLKALELAGFAVELASDLRLLDLNGDALRQSSLLQEARDLVPKLVHKGRQEGWRLWVTYHNYYKAPDLLGPPVSRVLGIPYVQIESTRARKRLSGPWSLFAKYAEEAAEAANAIFHFTARDAEALHAYAPTQQRIVHLRPFLTRTELPLASDLSGNMISVAMMRHGDKLESYELISHTLPYVNSDWVLDIVGDGKARSEIEALLHPFADRVRFHGAMSAPEIDRLLHQAKLMFWPGVNEAIGLVYLEAQAAGVPIVAQDRPGLRDVITPGQALVTPEGGPKAMALAIDRILQFPPNTCAIRDHVERNHLLPSAAKTLRETLLPMLGAPS